MPLSFTVTAVSPKYQLTCETPGAVGNNYTGDLTAITYVDGLTTAQVTDILVPGEDEESDDSLRTRCIDHMNSNPFGGMLQVTGNRSARLMALEACRFIRRGMAAER